MKPSTMVVINGMAIPKMRLAMYADQLLFSESRAAQHSQPWAPGSSTLFGYYSRFEFQLPANIVNTSHTRK